MVPAQDLHLVTKSGRYQKPAVYLVINTYGLYIDSCFPVLLVQSTSRILLPVRVSRYGKPTNSPSRLVAACAGMDSKSLGQCHMRSMALLRFFELADWLHNAHDGHFSQSHHYAFDGQKLELI
eukprot:5890600-Pleurochrysis_carterae.AAC.1